MNPVRQYLGVVGEKQLLLRGHSDFITVTTFDPFGRYLASGSRDGTVRIWDIKTGVATKILQGQDSNPIGVTFSPDGKLLTSVWWDRIKTWEVNSGRKVKESKLRANSRRHAASFSSDRSLIAVGSGASVDVFRINPWQKLFALQGHEREVWSVKFNPKFNVLAATDIERNVYL